MKNPLRCTFTTITAMIAIVALAACESKPDESAYERINPGAGTLSIVDFEAIGFKVVKEYDVKGLTGASTAIHGFMPASADLAPQSYEIRFYENHDDAVTIGTSFAEEITGEDAVMVADEMSWAEGKKEQRERATDHGGYAPFFWDYAIFGNVVLLCEGDWPEQSQQVCDQLTAKLKPTNS